MLCYFSMIETQEDQDKFERIYTKYRNLMYHAAYQVLQNHHDAEDAVHQAFISVIRHIKNIKEIDSPKTRSFLVLITERKAIDILRVNRRDKIVALDEEIAGILIPPPGDNGLADALAKLPAHYRQVLMLRFDNGFSVRELAGLLGISESGVRHLIRRARNALARELEREGSL